jgi:hypothetical protein
MRLPHRERKLCREGRWCWNRRSSERFSLSDWSYFPLAVAAGIFLVPLLLFELTPHAAMESQNQVLIDIDRVLSPW